MIHITISLGDPGGDRIRKYSFKRESADVESSCFDKSLQKLNPIYNGIQLSTRCPKNIYIGSQISSS